MNLISMYCHCKIVLHEYLIIYCHISINIWLKHHHIENLTNRSMGLDDSIKFFYANNTPKLIKKIYFKKGIKIYFNVFLYTKKSNFWKKF